MRGIPGEDRRTGLGRERLLADKLWESDGKAGDRIKRPIPVGFFSRRKTGFSTAAREEIRMNFTLLAAAAVTELVNAVARMGAEYAQSVQDAAVQCIAHAVEHGNVTLATQLVASVRPHHAACLVTFFEENGPFKYQKQAKAFEKNKFWTGKFDPTKIGFWEKATAPAKVISVYDVDEAFDAFLKVAHKKMEKAGSVKNRDLLERLESAQALFNAQIAASQAKAIIAKAKSELEEMEEVSFPPLAAVNQ